MRGGDVTTIAPASDRAVAQETDRTFLAELMKRARTWFRHKPSFELAEIVGCPVRTAERYFAGDRTPDALALMKLLRSPVGVRFIEEATRNLPPARYRDFWREVGMAALRAQLRERQEVIKDI